MGLGRNCVRLMVEILFKSHHVLKEYLTLFLFTSDAKSIIFYVFFYIIIEYIILHCHLEGGIGGTACATFGTIGLAVEV